MTGFPSETLRFLEGIAANNEKPWFEANRALYEAGFVAPARSFVAEIGPKLRAISADVQFDPKINGSISRVNRDVRFSNDKRPYKDHLDLWFWHGEKKGWNQPGFYLRITPSTLYLGAGMHAFDKEMLAAYRDAVITDAPGKALLKAVAAVTDAGYTLGGKSRKQVPRGYDSGHARAEYLLHDSLYAGIELPATAALDKGFGELCLTHFRATWPIGAWLLKTIA